MADPPAADPVTAAAGQGAPADDGGVGARVDGTGRAYDYASVVPGELLLAGDPVPVNAGAERTRLRVMNGGDRPIQVGSHFHLAQANPALVFDREAAHGLRLDVPAGTAIRFEPGIEREVELVPITGAREVWGLSLPAPGRLDAGQAAAPGIDPGSGA